MTYSTKNTISNYDIEKARPTGCTCNYPALLVAGWPESAIKNHHQNCKINDIRVNLK